MISVGGRISSSSDKLLNYLMLVQTLSEVKIEMLNNHDFYLGEISYLCHVIGERIEVTPMISIDSHHFYHFGYPLF